MNMRKSMRRYLAGIVLVLLVTLNLGMNALAWGHYSSNKSNAHHVNETEICKVEEDGEYTSKEEVAEYLHEFEHLPDNYITKKEAKKLGWVSTEGNLWKVAPGKCIGGDYFGNYEGILPEVKGRDYHECDIDSDGKYRGAKRIIYSSDGWIYYTEDHYKTFDVLYEGE